MSAPALYIALDTPDREQALALARQVGPHADGLKLGLEFFCANGPRGVAALAEVGLPVFLDLKLHDIPNTVAGAIRSLAGLPIHLLTLHAGGGAVMMRAAREAAEEKAAEDDLLRMQVVGVTVLTSLDGEDLAALGYRDAPPQQVVRMAQLAQEAGLDGVVCSPHELPPLRGHSSIPADFKLVVPGIRPGGSAAGDQKRTATPQEARDSGADYLVVGRPVTRAEDPATAAAAIQASLRGHEN